MTKNTTDNTEIERSVIVKQTIESLKKVFHTKGMYRLNRDKNLFCIHVNSLVNIGLAELEDESVSENIKSITNSNLFSPDQNLFYREINDKNEVTISCFNVCKNALAILSLISNDEIEFARKVVDTLYGSPLFDKESGLFFREMDSTTEVVNNLIISQTNLWMILVLAKLGEVKRANELMTALEKVCTDKESGMFLSQDCEREQEDDNGLCIKEDYKSLFSDDQGLAIIAYYFLGQIDKAKAIIDKVLDSNLYDRETGMFNRNFDSKGINTVKTSYKNSLMCIALNLLGNKEESEKVQEGLINTLFDKKENLFNASDSDSTKVPDNSMLALLAISGKSLKHIIF